MKTLHDLKNKALAPIYLKEIQEALINLFSQFGQKQAQRIIELSNRLPGDLRGNQLKGAVGEAIVVAAMTAYFGHYDGIGYFEGQYEMWMGRDLDAPHPMRKMDIVFIKPVSKGRSVTFQVEIKNSKEVIGKSKLESGDLRVQVDKDEGYLKPTISYHQGIVPIWVFLQGTDQAARGFLEGKGIRVVDFRKNLRHEIDQAFAT